MGAELTSISVSCFFVAGIFYTLWWLDTRLVIPSVAGCILFATCICIKIAIGHNLSPPSIHVSTTVFYALFFIIDYASSNQNVELPTIIKQTPYARMSKFEVGLKIFLILSYTAAVLWSRLYIDADTMNEAIIGLLLGVMFFLIVLKVTPSLSRLGESEKNE